ncbi:MAG TPA: ABC transporter permease [Stellaceae bacterium]|nr:ABC transporter permease [Stellaceae bacterium]
MSDARRNRVLLILVAIALAACLAAGFLGLAPNRLTSPRPIHLWHALDEPTLAATLALGAILATLSFLRASPRTALATLVASSALMLLLLFAAGESAAALMASAPRAVRVSLGAAFWIAIFCLAISMADALRRLGAGAVARFLFVVLFVLALAAMAQAGVFSGLSLAREYAARRDLFAAALDRHGILVLVSVAAALVIGVPLGLLTARRPASAGPIFATLNLLQTIPSIALFGLLIVPLSALAAAAPGLAALGIGGIGPAPAITALVLYALLPVVRNTRAGIDGVDPAIIDAAMGMGLSQAQIFWRIELPLGLPVFLAGLRIVLVQTIGLAVVAALIGAGGLGTFVFQGIGQYATDLVLLGAIPTILLALAADFLLTLAIELSRRRQLP